MKPQSGLQRNSDKCEKLPPSTVKYLLKVTGNLNRTAMAAGNNHEFAAAFQNINEALTHARELGKTCLEAKVLNNMGLLYTMSGQWDKAMLAYEAAMDLVTDQYGTGNVLCKTLQKNIQYLFAGKFEPVDKG